MTIQKYPKSGLAVRHELDRPCRWLSLVSLVAAAATVVLAAGCLAAPTKSKKEPMASPPVAPENSGTTTASVDLTKAYEPNPFRHDVTTDQRIHVHIDLGRVFESQGNHEAALMEYEQALEACQKKSVGRSRSADEALVHRRIAGSLDRLGRFAQAELHYKKAIKLSPKDAKIWNDAGYSYYLQGRWADAARTLKTAAKLAPENSRILTNLGLTLAAAGKTQEALPLLSQYSGDAIGHANLGFLLAATGQVDMARQQYLQALALRPSMSLARRALQQLDRAAPEGSTNAVASQKPADAPQAPPALAHAPSDRSVAAVTIQKPADAPSAPPALAHAPSDGSVAAVAIQKPADAPPAPPAPARAPSDGSVAAVAGQKPAKAPPAPPASARAPRHGSMASVASQKPANARQAPPAPARAPSDRSVSVASQKPASAPQAPPALARAPSDGSVVKTQATRRQIPPPRQSTSVDLFSPSAGESSWP
ncbi:MAG: tetratricopeptide repeat protein [Isosphaeraceae bacterium]